MIQAPVSVDPALSALLDYLETRLGPVVRVVRDTAPPPGGSAEDRSGHAEGVALDITTRPSVPLGRLTKLLEGYPGIRVVADHPGWIHVQRID